jgi:hypothetical protein
MEPDSALVAALQASWSAQQSARIGADYLLVDEFDGVYAAWSSSGQQTLIVPVIGPMSSAVIGRRAAGFELVGHSSMRFALQGRVWAAPGAALVCCDPELAAPFGVLCADIACRVAGGGATWQAILSAVEEWQTLLAPRGRPSAEVEVGLWGELWFIDSSLDVDRAVASWCGPEKETTDFFVGGVGAEVKTSRSARQHFVSQTQLVEPIGTRDAWLLSLWVKPSPGARTVADMVKSVLARVSDRADAIRRMASAGFSLGDQALYTAGFELLSEPDWYAVSDVPRVRVVDQGISQLRYRVELDRALRAEQRVAERLWLHFQGRKYGG